MSRTIIVSLCLLAVASSASAAVQLDISSGFNSDVICGALEFQEIFNYKDATGDSKDLMEVQVGHMKVGSTSYQNFIMKDKMPIGAADAGSGLTYSLAGWGSHERYATDAQALPADGVITGSSFTYHMASHMGNATLPGDWTEVAAPTIDLVEPLGSMEAKNNAMFAYSSRLDQTYATTATLPTAAKYSDINFVLGGSRFGALNMRIVAVYADASEEIIYAFPTEETAGDIGPIIDDTLADDYDPSAFNVVEQYSNGYLVSASGTGNWSTASAGSLFEFAVALDLDGTKDLAGIRLEDAGGLSASTSRGLVIFAASATPVPEPATLSLIAIGGIAMIRRRRR